VKRIFRSKSDKILFWTGFTLGVLSIINQISIRGGLENSGPISFLDIPMSGLFFGFIFWGIGRMISWIHKRVNSKSV